MRTNNKLLTPCWISTWPGFISLLVWQRTMRWLSAIFCRRGEKGFEAFQASSAAARRTAATGPWVPWWYGGAAVTALPQNDQAKQRIRKSPAVARALDKDFTHAKVELQERNNFVRKQSWSCHAIGLHALCFCFRTLLQLANHLLICHGRWVSSRSRTKQEVKENCNCSSVISVKSIRSHEEACR